MSPSIQSSNIDTLLSAQRLAANGATRSNAPATTDPAAAPAPASPSTDATRVTLSTEGRDRLASAQHDPQAGSTDSTGNSRSVDGVRAATVADNGNTAGNSPVRDASAGNGSGNQPLPRPVQQALTAYGQVQGTLNALA